MTTNPYRKYVEGMDPIASLEQTAKRIESLMSGWTPEMFERSYAPGKWTARQLMTHLVHIEMVFGERVRYGLAAPGYVVVPFEQDDWIRVENTTSGAAALAAFSALRRVNLELFRSLTPVQRAQRFQHPEHGEIDVEWVIVALAGHDRHHLSHLEKLALGSGL